ncbi:hypothetical protein [Streptacidiphilus carbonis]|uniref:hypothetical protein n=1 Tax=Streptacidiphilus carbonis TaxID=105422 RepID=UPI0006937117|nr:hypothetical protein [Streptacidiphilus carbonis]
MKADDSFVPGLREDPTQELATVTDGPSPEEILAEPPDTRDIAGELAAPPRRKLPWLTLALAGGIIAALGFAGGALVEKNNKPAASSAATAFAGFTRGAAGGTGRTGGTAGTGATGGATTGTVKLVDGDTVYITDSSGNTVKVTTGSSTKVTLSSTGKVGDLKAGQTVTVRGTTDSSGNLAATTVSEGAATAAGGFGAGGFGGAGTGG